MQGRVRNLVKAARSLSGREWLTLIRVSFLLPAVWLGLHLMSLPKLLRQLDPGVSPGETEDEMVWVDPPRRISWLVNGAARVNPFPTSCLTRSVVLWRLLRLRGISAEIRLGVNNDAGFAAHAWVEVDGQPVNDASEPGSRFAAFSGELIPKR